MAEISNTFDPRPIAESEKTTIENVYLPQKLFQESLLNADKHAANLQTIRDARLKHDQDVELFELTKKQKKIDLEKAILGNNATSIQTKMMEQALKDSTSQDEAILKGKSALIDKAEHDTATKLEQSKAIAQNLYKTSPVVKQSVHDVLNGLFPITGGQVQEQTRVPNIPSAGGILGNIPTKSYFDTNNNQQELPINQQQTTKSAVQIYQDKMNSIAPEGYQVNPNWIGDTTGKQEQWIKSTESRAVPISDSEVESKAKALLEGRLAPSQLPKFGGAASIFNKVTAKALEIDPTFNMTLAEQDFVSKKSALNQMMKTSSLIKSFEATAYKNANVLEMLADRVDWRGKSPLLNNLKQSWNMRVVQDPATASAKTALVTFTNEYAKIMSGQTGGAAVSDAARKEASELISLTDNPEAFASRIEIMKQDMKNRRDGLDEEIADLRGKKVEKTIGTEELTKNDLPEGVTEEDVQHTMKKHNVTREQVLKRIRGK